MTENTQDIWSQWLLDRRFGGDLVSMQNALTGYLYPWRDQILEHASLREGDVLLDVGCGDGLVAFGALQKTRTGRVVFSDISADLLEHSRLLAEDMRLVERCQFVQAPAENLSQLQDGCVDVVTTRSVLIYVAAKQQAFCEFHRVLKPGGRLSIFEPVNRFAEGEPDHLFGGYDVTPVAHLSRRIKSVYEQLQPMHSDPMMDFDERDLVRFAEQAGFSEIHLELQIAIQPITEKRKWEIFIQSPPNPKVPSAQEVMQQVLTPEEIEQFTACLRPLVEQGVGVHRAALAYLWAVK